MWCSMAWAPSFKSVVAKAFWTHFFKYSISPGRLKGDARGAEGKCSFRTNSSFSLSARFESPHLLGPPLPTHQTVQFETG